MSLRRRRDVSEQEVLQEQEASRIVRRSPMFTRPIVREDTEVEAPVQKLLPEDALPGRRRELQLKKGGPVRKAKRKTKSK